MKTGNIILIVIIILIIILGGYFWYASSSKTSYMAGENGNATTSVGNETATNTATTTNSATTSENTSKEVSIIGKSVEGRDIKAYHFGTGAKEVLFVGGLHGGYAPNTSALSFHLVDWLKQNKSSIPENVSVTVIPVLNPDGLAKVVGDNTASFSLSGLTVSDQTRVAGRFNAHNVDLNRNFACNWKNTATWQGHSVNPGTSAFSEPEAIALRDYVTTHHPEVAVVYYAKAGGVYTASCGGNASEASKELMDAYASASGYKASGDFGAYPTPGDATNWMAKEGVTAISVLLPTYTEPAWSQNESAIKATLDYASNN